MTLFRLLRFALVLSTLALSAPPSSSAAALEVGAIGLTVGQLDRALNFYTNVLPFVVVSESRSSLGEADALLGLANTESRTVELALGKERITLTEHLNQKGRPVPQDSRSFDLWFQHLAIVVRDMDEAYQHLLRHRVQHVSTAPQTLPEWNTNAAGIKAFYFQDSEAHVLEIISFPPGKGDPKWQTESGPLFLGIDHSAIVVSDTAKSLAFYRDKLGFRVVGTSENFGPEQEHLNLVFGARLHITALRAPRGPGVEFLEYIAPPGGRALSAEANARDLTFWSIPVLVESYDTLIEACRHAGLTFVSHKMNTVRDTKLPRRVFLRDPDGHALQLVESTERVTASP